MGTYIVSTWQITTFSPLTAFLCECKLNNWSTWRMRISVDWMSWMEKKAVKKTLAPLASLVTLFEPNNMLWIMNESFGERSGTSSHNDNVNCFQKGKSKMNPEVNLKNDAMWYDSKTIGERTYFHSSRMWQVRRQTKKLLKRYIVRDYFFIMLLEVVIGCKIMWNSENKTIHSYRINWK